MIRLNVNYKQLVFGLIPPNKRMPVRVFLLQCFAAMTALFSEFCDWRSFRRILVNVNSRVAVLEGFLRWKYDPSIRILTYNEDLTGISLYIEGQLLSIGLILYKLHY